MSQKGPAPRPAPHRTSRSPPAENPGQAVNRGSLPPGSSDAGFDPHRVGHSNGDYRPQTIPPRPLGVHNILNPPDARPAMPETGGPPYHQGREPEGGAATPTIPGAYGPARSFPSMPQTSSSHPGTPIGPAPPFGMPQSADRASPSGGGYPFPALNNPRNMPSPRLTRASSIGPGGPHREVDPRHHHHHQPFPSTASPSKRPYEPDVPDERRVSLPPVHQQPPGPSRMSQQPQQQPMGRLGEPPVSNLGTPRGAREQQQPPLQMPPQQQPQQFQHGVPPGRPYSRGQSIPDAVPGSAWSEVYRRPPGMPGSLMAANEPSEALLTLPGSDTPIPVQVDYSQASKKADEKRWRNAKASTRHRKKKKTMQEENVKRLQELQNERQQMFQHIEEVTRQRDFYREDRNRLRDLVSRTASISEMAAGPPSPPASTRPTGFFAEESTLLQSHAAASQGYASDASSVERPAQRRRTEERADFAVHAYALPAGGQQQPQPQQPQPGGLPPMQGQGYGIPRPLSAVSSGSMERLPPLRAMEGPPGPPGPPPAQPMVHGQPQEQDPRTGHWGPLQTRYLETGWATASRHPGDPSR